MSTALLERRLSWAGWLIASGLVVELAVATLVHPLAFVTFAVVTVPLVLAGVALFLWALVAG
ncbi:MAG: hypothetical protein ABL986_13835 [Vicinamibacterales bacterium]